MIPNGIFTTREAESCGINRMQLLAQVEKGEVERLARGVYARTGGEYASFLEAAILAKRGTRFVLSLESALRFHGLTTAVPHALWVAIPRGARRPAVDFPLEVSIVDRRMFSAGVEIHGICGVDVSVYSAAKTVADLFKFRSRVGLELAIEGMKEGLRCDRFSVDELMRHAEIDRVESVVRPYVEGYFS